MSIYTHTAKDSSFIHHIAWDSSTSVLAVLFRSGSLWLYENVSLETYDELVTSSSVGSYFNKHVRDIFLSTKAAFIPPYEQINKGASFV